MAPGNIPYTQDLTDCFSGEIGEGGLEPAVFDRYLAQSEAALERIRTAYADNALPLLALPEKHDDLAEITAVADRFRSSFDDVVILGTGGSSLGGQTLCSLADSGFGPRPGAPRLHFMDNVDPHTFDGLIRSVNWQRTGIIAISKSGSTAETLFQLGVLLQALREHVPDDEVADHVVAITEATENPVTVIARGLGCTVLEHHAAIGGRYSVLSVTGMLPAAIAGLDIARLRAGAATITGPLLSGAATADIPPAAGAALAVGLNRNAGTRLTVLMPYCDRLADLGLWFCQLWAESIGKQGEGTTPVRAIGTVDQHSQLQLYLDGPADKMFSLILTETAGQGAAVPAEFSDIDGLSYLAGRTMGDLLAVAGRATAETLANNGRPTRVFHVPVVDEMSMGALMMHFMVETMIMADLIGVNAFDQPAVEESKILAREYLAKGDAG
jgi:glucose-6-phosphate isomerase